MCACRMRTYYIVTIDVRESWMFRKADIKILPRIPARSHNLVLQIRI
jgi:hypothetical protein